MGFRTWTDSMGHIKNNDMGMNVAHTEHTEITYRILAEIPDGRRQPYI
jgi:hypothetical protein